MKNEPAHKIAHFFKGSVKPKMRRVRAGAEPVTPTGPAICGINVFGVSWDIVGFLVGICIVTPFAYRLQSEASHERARLLEGLISIFDARATIEAGPAFSLHEPLYFRSSIEAASTISAGSSIAASASIGVSYSAVRDFIRCGYDISDF